MLAKVFNSNFNFLDFTDFIRKTMKIDVEEELILKIFCIGYINDFSTKVSDSKVRLVYPRTAMLSHDCKPNVVR